MSMSDLVVVVLGVDVHPGSGRRVVPRSDVAALEMALDLGRPLLALHAGDPSDPALKNYLGLGLLTLAVVSALATAGGEWAYYAAFTGIDPSRVLQANLTTMAGLRPAWVVLAITLSLPLAATIWLPIERWRKARTQPA